jgi:hypothetical protein
MYIYTHVYIYIYININVYIHMYMHCSDDHIYAFMYICTLSHMHSFIYISIYAYICIYIEFSGDHPLAGGSGQYLQERFNGLKPLIGGTLVIYIHAHEGVFLF